MKTNFTPFVKVILAALFFFAGTTTFANNTTPAISGNLKVSVENNSLVMNWNLADASTVNYCEIQGSEDGKTFTTIGYVMGANPAHDNSYSFKQTLSKIKPGKIYFRVLIIGADEKATSSEVVKLSK